MATGTLTNAHLALSKSAFETEHNRKFDEAIKLHGSAITELEKSTHDGKIFRTDEVRLAKMQMKIHQKRYEVLQSAITLKKDPEYLLPTHWSVIDEVVLFMTTGKTHIGFETKLLREWLAKPAPRPDPPPQVTHLLTGTAPFYTPTLAINLPTKTFYIDYSTEGTVRNSGTWLYFKAKAKPGGEDVYQMHTLTRKNKQNCNGLFYRTANLFEPIMQIAVTPLAKRPTPSQCIEIGRPIQITGSSGMTYERPDRVSRKGWTPRRFDFGGRNFVWKNEGGPTSSFNESLFEVESVWAKAGSKTGKMEDKTLRKLCWMERKSFGNKYYIVHFAGGIDQLFQEYLLASHMARQMVQMQFMAA